MAPTKDQKYLTHYNYAKCINGMLFEIEIDLPKGQKHKIDTKRTQNFYTLAKLTTRSINSEIRICRGEPEYSEVVAHWIPVKAYYRTYYLEAILLHLVSGDASVYRSGGHTKARNGINTFCKSGFVKTKSGEAEKVTLIADALTHRIRAGANISPTYFFSQDCVKSVRRKIAEYIEYQWKNNEKIDYRSAANKQRRDQFRQRKKLTFLDYFYQMRLKANYKDTGYLDFDEITYDQSVKFISMFNSANMRYVSALDRAIKIASATQGIVLS